MRVSAAIASIVLLAFVSACTKSQNTAVPRRQAYPRIMPYDSSYVMAEALPLKLLVNRDAVTEVTRNDDGAVWLNIHYPRYGATVYCTLTPVNAESVQQTLDNRAERIHRNLGVSTPEIDEFVNQDGYHNTLVSSVSLNATPVQFISVNPDNPSWVVSGAAFFEDAASITSADSVRPMTDIMQRDIRVMLNSLND